MDERSTKSKGPTSLHGLHRLQDFDYARAGAYFLTLVLEGRPHLMGEVAEGEMSLKDAGRVVADCWTDLPNHYPHVRLDAFVVMPNHVHGVLILSEENGIGLNDEVKAGLKPAPTKRHAVPEVVRGFKTFSARCVNKSRRTLGCAVWQRNYYEHVIRDDRCLDRIREYIVDNPRRWNLDRENPARTGRDEFDRWLESLPKPQPTSYP